MTKNNDFIKGGFPLIVPLNKPEEETELKERHMSVHKNILDINTIINNKKGSPIVDFVIEGNYNKKVSRNKKTSKKTSKINIERIKYNEDENIQEMNFLNFINDLNISPIKRQIKKKSNK